MSRLHYWFISIPPDWSRHVHPLGTLYYVKRVEGRDYITESNPLDSELRLVLQSIIETLESRISAIDVIPSDGIQIYIDPYYDGTMTSGYYMVNTAPTSRRIFWIDAYNLAEITEWYDTAIDIGQQNTTTVQL